MNVFIRTDASTEIGTGHVMRCLVLAKQLQKRNVTVYFICRKLAGNLISYIEEQGFPVISLQAVKSENDYNWFENHWKRDSDETIALMKPYQQIDWLIIDHYGIDIRWEKEMKPHVQRMMVIDDLANRPHICDLLLDQNVLPQMEKRYNHLIPKRTKQLLGIRYILLREEFTRYKNFNRDVTHVKNILISFGGADETNETLKALQALTSFNTELFTIHVVIGSTSPHAETIKTYRENYTTVKIYENINNISYLMKIADIAIGAGGSTTWERCYMLLPTITIETAPNQSEILAYLSKLGAVYHLGKSSNVSERMIGIAVQTLMEEHQVRLNMITVLESLLEGFQDNLVVDELISFQKGEGI